MASSSDDISGKLKSDSPNGSGYGFFTCASTSPSSSPLLEEQAHLENKARLEEQTHPQYQARFKPVLKASEYERVAEVDAIKIKLFNILEKYAADETVDEKTRAECQFWIEYHNARESPTSWAKKAPDQRLASTGGVINEFTKRAHEDTSLSRVEMTVNDDLRVVDSIYFITDTADVLARNYHELESELTRSNIEKYNKYKIAYNTILAPACDKCIATFPEICRAEAAAVVHELMENYNETLKDIQELIASKPKTPSPDLLEAAEQNGKSTNPDMISPGMR